MVDAMLRCQLRQRQVTPDRFQRHLCLELRAVALPRLLHFPSIPQVGISLAPCPNFRDHLRDRPAGRKLTLSADACPANARSSSTLARAVPHRHSRSERWEERIMVRNWVAGALALGGLVVGALVGPHVPGLAANGRGAAAGSELADRIAIEDMVTRYYGNFGRQDAAEDFGAFYTEDAVFDVNGIVSEGREAIEAFYAENAEEPRSEEHTSELQSRE